MTADYLLLTGGKNNAGDFLIKHRAKALLKKYRPDRQFMDVDGWEPFSDKTLESANRAKAIILTGGPSLQHNMRETIYPMVPDLNDLKIPIIMFGVGWKSEGGEWEDTKNYYLSEKTKKLLERIQTDGFKSSVRDYHTLSVLQNYGMDNVLMTGCPALYNLQEQENTDFVVKSSSRVSYSTGVGFAVSPSMEKTNKNIILALKKKFKNLTVVFHHSIKDEAFEAAYKNTNPALLEKQRELANWLLQESIEYVDVSGSAEAMMNHYLETDLHVGYRVHAHIFMTSMKKPSLLIAEDGRGKALKDVVGGLIFDGYVKKQKAYKKKQTLIGKKKIEQDPFIAPERLEKDIISSIDYEMQTNLIRFNTPFHMVKQHKETMLCFLESLP